MVPERVVLGTAPTTVSTFWPSLKTIRVGNAADAVLAGDVASQYGIRSIPTLMVFKDGQKVDTVVGAVPKTTLSGTISKYL